MHDANTNDDMDRHMIVIVSNDSLVIIPFVSSFVSNARLIRCPS